MRACPPISRPIRELTPTCPLVSLPSPPPIPRRRSAILPSRPELRPAAAVLRLRCVSQGARRPLAGRLRAVPGARRIASAPLSTASSRRMPPASPPASPSTPVQASPRSTPSTTAAAWLRPSRRPSSPLNCLAVPLPRPHAQASPPPPSRSAAPTSSACWPTTSRCACPPCREATFPR